MPASSPKDCSAIAYVNITRGFKGAPLQDNQEIPGVGENGINELVSQGANLAQHFNMLTDQINGLIADIRAGKGSVGKFVTDDAFYNNFASVTEKFNDMLASVQAGQGIFGKLYTHESDELYTKADSSVTHIDNILDAIEQQKGTCRQIHLRSQPSRQFESHDRKGQRHARRRPRGEGHGSANS